MRPAEENKQIDYIRFIETPAFHKPQEFLIKVGIKYCPHRVYQICASGGIPYRDHAHIFPHSSPDFLMFTASLQRKDPYLIKRIIKFYLCFQIGFPVSIWKGIRKQA